MPDDPTQPTQPKKGEPVDIPVPSRRQVEDALERVAKPPSERRSGRRKRRTKQ
jgi:hypothetical protein